jgi:hypothetical protein
MPWSALEMCPISCANRPLFCGWAAVGMTPSNAAASRYSIDPYSRAITLGGTETSPGSDGAGYAIPKRAPSRHDMRADGVQWHSRRTRGSLRVRGNVLNIDRFILIDAPVRSTKVAFEVDGAAHSRQGKYVWVVIAGFYPFTAYRQFAS